MRLKALLSLAICLSALPETSAWHAWVGTGAQLPDLAGTNLESVLQLPE